MASPNPGYALEYISVLVLDENLHMRDLIREILLALGIKDTSLVSNVPRAFKELLHFAADIITTDWHLEPLDGFRFVKLVRTALESRNP
jgi:two-component system chemotaxis response regulator CheY